MDDQMALPITTPDLIKELEGTVTETGLCLSYWRVFNDPEHPKERPAVRNLIDRYPLFYRTAQHAFLTTALVDVYKLYDKRRDTATMVATFKAVTGQREGWRGAIDAARRAGPQ